MVHAWCRSTTLSSCSSGILELRVSGTMNTTEWTNSMASSCTWIKSLTFLSLRTCEVYSFCYRTCNNAYRMDLKWLVWHLESSSESDSCCSDVQIPALEPKMDTLGISFSYPEAVTGQAHFRRPTFVYCGVDSHSVDLAVHFSFNL
jgi:hypothetical protein